LFLGVFAEATVGRLLSSDEYLAELRWVLILGMPIVLVLNHYWLGGRRSATSVTNKALFLVGQIAIFLGPIFWAYNR